MLDRLAGHGICGRTYKALTINALCWAKTPFGNRRFMDDFSQDGFTGRTAPDGVPVAEAFGLHDGEHLFACLDRVASLQSIAPANAPAAVNRRAGDEGHDGSVPSFDSLVEVAGARGVELNYHEGRIGEQDAATFPVIAVLKNGLGIIVTELDTDGHANGDDPVLCLHGRVRMLRVGESAFDDFYTGVMIAPRAKVDVSAPAVEPETRPTKLARPVAIGSIEPIRVRASTGASDTAQLPAQASAPFTAQSTAPTTPTDDTDLQERSLQWTLFAMMRQQRGGLLVQLLAAVAMSNLLVIALPLFIMTIYDRVIPHRAMETLWALSIGVLLALALDLVLRRIRLVLVDAVGLSAATRMQARLYRKLLHVRTAAAPKTAGALTSALKDIEGIALLLPALMAGVLVDLPFIVLVLVLIYNIAGSVVWAPVAGIAIIALATFLAHRKVTAAGAEETGMLHRKFNTLIETVSSLGAIKATSAQSALQTGWDKALDDAVLPGHKARLYGGYSAHMTMIVVQGVIVFSVIIGVYRISAGTMSVGALAATTLLVGRVLGPVGQLMSLVVRAGHLTQSASLVTRLLEAPEELGGDTAHMAKITDARIACHKVCFTYDGAAVPALNDVSLTIEPGEKVGIVGRNGCGKSTLLQVMTRFYDPGSGTVTIDNTNALQIEPDALRRSIALMGQDTQLFDSTLYGNLVFGLEALDEQRFQEAVAVSGLAEFVRGHADGYSMQVGPRGERLSGGERQSVLLSRTLMRPAKVFLLDEPTSALDNSTEGRIVAGLRAHVGDATLVVATHRANMLTLVDRIIWMDKGRIIADGPREEVLGRLRKAA